MTGVLVADKPAGWSSHDVVRRVKRLLGAAKVGHLGTLDPAATGVLPLVINRATRFASWLERGEKEYAVEMTLGAETETYDSEGPIIRESDPGEITAGDLERVLSGFRGTISQVPPMFSAVKRKGRPLYKLARKGITIERPPRDVEIFALEMTSIDMPVVSFTLRCGRGTYVRSLCHDAGKMLGCGAYMSALRRIQSGAFHISEAIDPAALEKEALEGAIIPLGEALLRAVEVFRDVSLDDRALRIEGAEEDIIVSDVMDLAIGTRVILPTDKGFFPFKDEGEMIRFTLNGLNLALASHIRGQLCKIKWVFEGPCNNEARKVL
ncbi:MAG: tRNA pseudouridine(55) synthase TruB [Thermodesulfobacteriota bacterium]